MIRKISLLFVFINLLKISTFSQPLLSPEVIATAGDFSKNSNLQVSWTLGEISTETFFSSTLSFTQGFQQHSYSFEVENSINKSEFYSDLKIYPNPFQYFFKIDIIIKENINLSIELYTLDGKKLLLQTIKSGENIIYIPSTVSEILILRIINKAQILHSLKLIKN